MAIELVPRPYAALMTQHILDNPRCALFAFMGAGKTNATLLAIDELLFAGKIRKVLILAPLRVARSTWPEEAQKWKQLSHLSVQPIVGTQAERRAALNSGADIFTMNYENIPWLVETLGDAWPFDMVVADESTRLKSFRLRQGGKRAAALKSVAHLKTARWVNLTGTPAPNGLMDLWGQTWFLDQGQRLGRTFSAFVNRWFRARPGSDPRYPVLEPVAHAQDEMQALLKEVCLTLDAKDWFDLDAPIVNTLYVDLPPKARKHYREMEKELFTSIAGNEIEAFGAAAKSMKCLQMANGAAYINETNDEWEVIHDEKLKALESIVEEASGAPVLVAYDFRSDLHRILAHFPGARALDKQPSTIADWNAGKISMLIAYPGNAGHGLNLADGGAILVYFGHWWNLEERQQIAERIGPVRQKQAGHERPCYIYNIVARDTVDEQVIERIETKRDVQAILLDAMKRRNDG